MPRKQKKYHFIYKTTNLINNKFYVGMHSTDNLEDGYFGSGKIIRYSVNKHGIDNHQVEILEFLPSREELKKREAEIVNEDMLKHPLCMNLKFGGEGGWDHVSIESKIKGGQGAVRSLQWKESHSIRLKTKIEKGELKSNLPESNAEFWIGKKHSSVSIQKMKASHRGLQDGEKNSQFGTCWINNSKETKKIKKEELQHWITLGWSKGRKLPG